MTIWESWHDAIKWCWNNASEDCSVLVRDWFEPNEYGYKDIAHLKFESGSRCFFYKANFGKRYRNV